MSLDSFLAGGATALTLSLIGLYAFYKEWIVPYGRLKNKDEDLKEVKLLAKEAVAENRKKDEIIGNLTTAVKDLTAEVRVFIAAGQRGAKR